MASSETFHQRISTTVKSQWKYFLWAVPVSIVLLWPLTMYVGRMDELGSAGAAAAVPVAAFALGMAASLLTAPLFQKGGAARMLCADAGMLTGLMGVGLLVLAVIYFQSITLVIASAASGAVGATLAVWNIRARSVAPDYPAWLIAVAVFNIILVLVLGYYMLSMRWNA